MLNTDTHNTILGTTRCARLQQKRSREKSQLGWEGWGAGRDRGEGQAAQWVADSIWKGREEKARLERQEHATDTTGDASESSCSPG